MSLAFTVMSDLDSSGAGVPRLDRSAHPPVKELPRITVVVPTLNERDNVELIYREVSEQLAGIHFELIYVDDNSTDGTIEKIMQLEKCGNVRLILRVDRTGLSSAILDGFLAASSPICAVIDADLQHDQSLLPKYLEMLNNGDADIVIGTRYKEGGVPDGLSTALRQTLSNVGNMVACYFLTYKVSDPMSGTFALRRSQILNVARSVERLGYKILFDILHLSPKAKVIEIPYVFRAREHGTSKMSFRNQWDFLVHVLFMATFRVVPSPLLSFALVGLAGAFFHLTLFFACLALGAAFITAHTLAVVLATVFNFTLNNRTTFASVKLTGWKYVAGLLAYLLVSSIGIAFNIGAAQAIYGLYVNPPIASLAGVAVDFIWKYTISSSFIWRR